MFINRCNDTESQIKTEQMGEKKYLSEYWRWRIGGEGSYIHVVVR
jgi:hypothetical protein